MRTHLADHECHVPADIEEALAMRARIPGVLPIAGGTDVMVWMNDGKMAARSTMSLHRLAPQWRFVRPAADGGVVVGALATYTDVRHHEAIAARYPMLVESARVTGALQIQNRGTLAGNIANGSPAADTVPALMACDAVVRLASVAGTRDVPLGEFYTGYRRNVMRPDELISEIVLPPPAFGAGEWYYRKVGTREAQAISKVIVAGGRSRSTGAVRLAWGSVAPTTMRSRATEAAIARGATHAEAWEILRAEIAPIDDIRSTREYRLKVSRNLLAEFMARTGA